MKTFKSDFLSALMASVTLFSFLLASEANAAEDFRVDLASEINGIRAENGLSPLQLSSVVSRISQDWAHSLAQTGSFCHRPNMSSILRAQRWTYISENIYSTERVLSPKIVAKAWMASKGHRRHILDRKVTWMGVGVVKNSYGRYFVVMNAVDP
jgi:uncharacterized protein YkwD